MSEETKPEFKYVLGEKGELEILVAQPDRVEKVSLKSLLSIKKNCEDALEKMNAHIKAYEELGAVDLPEDEVPKEVPTEK